MSRRSSAKKKHAKGFDLERFINDFKGLSGTEPGVWPFAPKAAVCIGAMAAVVALSFWFIWKPQAEDLEAARAEETGLRQDWAAKKELAVNLVTYRRQLEEVKAQFNVLLKQLPDRGEMAKLLTEVNKAGVGRGLQFDLWKPGSEVNKEFYAEMPIDIQIENGSYNDLGAFVSDVAVLSRIVTINNVAIETKEDGTLGFKGQAVTYRYLDPDAAQEVQ